jgi:hypothetical protein
MAGRKGERQEGGEGRRKKSWRYTTQRLNQKLINNGEMNLNDTIFWRRLMRLTENLQKITAGHLLTSWEPNVNVSNFSEFAYKRCSIDGRWEGRTSGEYWPPQGWTNYTPCFTPEMLQLIKKLYAGSENAAKVRRLKWVLRMTAVLHNRVGFEVRTAVVIKSTIFWDITPCSILKVNRRFGGIYRLHLQGRKISRVRNHLESWWPAETSAFPIVSCFRSLKFKNWISSK